MEELALRDLERIQELLNPIDRPQGAWKLVHGFAHRILGLDCQIDISPRPDYCDRGNWLAHIETKPGGNNLRLYIDGQDAWPRYFFDLNRAKLEIEDWLRKRNQWLENELSIGSSAQIAEQK
jgi:hypothetical protein